MAHCTGLAFALAAHGCRDCPGRRNADDASETTRIQCPQRTSASIAAPSCRKDICLVIMPWRLRPTTLIETTRAGKPRRHKTR